MRSTVWFGKRRRKRRIAASSWVLSIGASVAGGTVAVLAAAFRRGRTVVAGSAGLAGLAARFVIIGPKDSNRRGARLPRP